MGTCKDKIDKSKNDKRPRFKMIKRFKEIDTGEFYPDRWRILHKDGTFSKDVDKVYLDKEFGPEYTSFVKTIGSSKYIPRPQFANKDSHLDKWPSLLRANAHQYFISKMIYLICVYQKHLLLFFILQDFMKLQKK